MRTSILSRAGICISSLLFLTNSITTSQAAATSSATNSSSVTSSTYSPNGVDLTVAVNVPSTNQDDDLYFSFSAADAPTWVAFGFGSMMQNALIFVVYESADGKNVTISPRLGGGHFEPQHTADVKIQTLAGSGIADNANYVANFKCTGCRSWTGGNKVDVTSTNQPIIWAAGPTGRLRSDDLAATIQQHPESYGFGSLNLAQATGPGGVPVAAQQNGGSSDGGFSATSLGRRVHAVFTVGAFVIGFPAGYLFLRVFDRVWIHWVIQSLAAVAVLCGMASGIILSIKQSISPSLTAYHQIIGFLVVAMVIATWAVGLLGHRMYKKNGTPAIPMKVHKILGPATVAFGLVNCAIGFHFAQNNGAIIGFVIITTLMIIFVSTVVVFALRRKNRKRAFNTPAAQNFRQGTMEPQYTGQTGEGVPLQPYGGGRQGLGVSGYGDGRPEPHSLPSYHSDGGQPPQYPPRYA